MTPDTTQPCALGITSETLSAWGDSLVDYAEARRLRDHVRSCLTCQSQLIAFAATLRALVSQRVPDIQD
jgi:hypothetical protein